MARPIKILIIVGGLIITAFVGWYAYTLAFEFKRAEVQALERAVAAGAKNLADTATELAKRAVAEGFAVKHVDACRSIVGQYRSPLGNVLRNVNVRELVNLPKEASKEQVQERCVEFAKAVAEMQKLSRHNIHVMVCPGSFFQVGEDDDRTVIPDEKGRGVLQSITESLPKAMPIRPGRSKIINTWQVYNMGDGCIIVGDSKKGLFLTNKVKE